MINTQLRLTGRRLAAISVREEKSSEVKYKGLSDYRRW